MLNTEPSTAELFVKVEWLIWTTDFSSAVNTAPSAIVPMLVKVQFENSALAELLTVIIEIPSEEKVSNSQFSNTTWVEIEGSADVTVPIVMSADESLLNFEFFMSTEFGKSWPSSII
jgi:hypothetical protein